MPRTRAADSDVGGMCALRFSSFVCIDIYVYKLLANLSRSLMTLLRNFRHRAARTQRNVEDSPILSGRARVKYYTKTSFEFRGEKNIPIYRTAIGAGVERRKNVVHIKTSDSTSAAISIIKNDSSAEKMPRPQRNFARVLCRILV